MIKSGAAKGTKVFQSQSFPFELCTSLCVCVCACVCPYLSDYALDTRQRQTLVVGFNNPLQQMVTKHLKDHTHIWVGESRSHIIIPLSFTHTHTNTHECTLLNTDWDTYAVDSGDLEVIY